jgi:broad specificity phosphatase PhoE
MKILEIRRHSLTKKGPSRGTGSSLSQEGVELARAIGAGLQHFDHVATSDIPRSAETAIAMGFSVTELIADLCPSDPDLYIEVGHHERWGWDHPFQRFAELVARSSQTARLGQMQVDTWQSVLEKLPDNGRALIISHGRVIESGFVTLFPNADFRQWGSPFRHCEGARIRAETSGVFSFELLRVDEETRLGVAQH